MSVPYRELKRRIKRSVTFEPCLPRSAKKPPSGLDWLHEIKHDGFRIVAQEEADNVRLITRNGYDFEAYRRSRASWTAKGSWSIKMAYPSSICSGIGAMTTLRPSALSI
jgi:hypothetical protein